MIMIGAMSRVTVNIFATTGVHSEFREAHLGPYSRNRISWAESKLLRDDSFTKSRKNIESSDTVQRYFKTVPVSGKNMMNKFYSFLIIGCFLIFRMTMEQYLSSLK